MIATFGVFVLLQREELKASIVFSSIAGESCHSIVIVIPETAAVFELLSHQFGNCMYLVPIIVQGTAKVGYADSRN